MKLAALSGYPSVLNPTACWDFPPMAAKCCASRSPCMVYVTPRGHGSPKQGIDSYAWEHNNTHLMLAYTLSTTTTPHMTNGPNTRTATETTTQHHHYVPFLAYMSTTSSDAATTTMPRSNTSDNNYKAASRLEHGKRTHLPLTTVGPEITRHSPLPLPLRARKVPGQTKAHQL